MTDIATLRTQVLGILQDPNKYYYSDDKVDNGVKLALLTYSNYLPLPKADVLTLARDGNEIDLSSLDDLLSIQRIYYPWVSTYSYDDQTPNAVKSWDLYFDAGSATALIDTSPPYPEGTTLTPMTGDKIRIHYNTIHTIEGLSGASITTIPIRYFSLIAQGAAGYTLLFGSTDRSDVLDTNLSERMGNFHLNAFKETLNQLLASSQRTSSVLSKWSMMDKYDRVI